MNSGKVAVVTGVGPGTGVAIVRRLVGEGYSVAMLARSEERLTALANELPNCFAYPVDVTDFHKLHDVLDQIETGLGAPEVLIHNAVGGAFGNFLEIDPKVLDLNFQTNVMAFLHLSRRLAPAMIKAGRGVIIATGNTSAWRGKKKFAGFAPTKAAQRILAESIARELGPQGIHVAYLTIDAVINVDWARKRYPEAPEDFFIQPDDIASEVLHLVRQPKGAWTFNAEVRPYRENW
ncbi:SDR family NAD(P)-dependent oxidoreductase [Pseudomonas sp. BN102]|uniref:SDR family NAD(P)-dependent oxidoreductase n=1 Tax=Pseudomonas sp. BN102 TaxID=2567886 RepID=UPI00245814C5|nr:SDR family NAD(P)-dependent oxidoreductase [Pseudomonas sp. BN102]MDH4612438.1 SDR family NAD(P)-dependent oxidoreductase [Pseudomonas sp. BN102]